MVEIRQIIRHRDRRAGRIFRIVTRDDAQDQRRIRDRPTERADLIERAGERDQTVARHAAVTRLEPDDAAQRRRLANGAACVGAQGCGRHPGRDRRRRAAAGAARNAPQVPRIARYLICAILRG